MSGPRFAFVPVMDHEIHVTEWGRPGAPALFMMHGLARTGRDFDEIAAALSDTYFVVCPDMIGRGRSGWATDPAVEYSVEYYAGIASDLIDHYGLGSTAWLGTSLGGQIGMHLASGGQRGMLDCLILNDIGPEVPAATIERILAYAGSPPRFTTHAQAENWLRETYAPFGPVADGFWQRMTRTSLRRDAEGQLTLHYDPAIVHQLVHHPGDMTTWERWTRITTPCHVLYGSRSDLLTPDIRDRMMSEGPDVGCTAFEHCGHAPSLSRAADIALVRGILGELTRSAGEGH